MCASLSKNQLWFGLGSANSFDSREQVRKSRKMIGEVIVTKVGRPTKQTRKDRLISQYGPWKAEISKRLIGPGSDKIKLFN